MTKKEADAAKSFCVSGIVIILGDKTKSGFVAIVGRPNVGKSTLMNHLIGQKIAITSRKPQTTRNQIRTVYTDERGQAVFLDTPGMMRETKNRLGVYMAEAAGRSLPQADVVLWLVEVSGSAGQMEKEIAKKLKKVSCPVILVINKIDTADKQAVGECISAYRELVDFSEVVAVSALRSINTDTLLDAIFRFLPYGPLYYDEETVTDQPMRQIAAEIIREKALRRLEEEIPHGIAVVIDKMAERNDGSLTDIEASIICEKESHKGIIIGKGGSMLKSLGIDARKDIEKMLEQKVNLKLYVKVRKDWRDSELYLKNFGYEKNELKS